MMVFGATFAYGPDTLELITIEAEVVERFASNDRLMLRYHYTVDDVTIAGEGSARSCRDCSDTIEVIYHPDDWGAAEIKGRWVPAPAIAVITLGALLAMFGMASILIRRNNSGTATQQEHPNSKPR